MHSFFFPGSFRTNGRGTGCDSSHISNWALVEVAIMIFSI